MNYWTKKEQLKDKALRHTTEMNTKYAEEINACIAATKQYTANDGDYHIIEKPIEPKRHAVLRADSVSAMFIPKLAGRRLCVLNFASYKNPGGMFLNGSSAQEECLCHESFLYNVLREKKFYYSNNKKDLNRGLYKHRALYTPNVRFIHNGQERFVDVLTCAAPNYSVGLKYGKFGEEENRKVLGERIVFVKDILQANNVDVAILGAWGCGVFQQNPVEVAKMWATYGTEDIVERNGYVHAIPDEPTLKKFLNVLKP